MNKEIKYHDKKYIYRDYTQINIYNKNKYVLVTWFQWINQGGNTNILEFKVFIIVLYSFSDTEPNLKRHVPDSVVHFIAGVNQSLIPYVVRLI